MIDSCYGATFKANEANQLDMYCGNTYSCYSAKVYCPYESIDACNIDCDAANQVCYSMRIYVPDDYKYGYLNLTCPNADIYSSPCSSLYFYCTDSTKSSTYWYYDNYKHEYTGCQNTGTDVCCPDFGGDLISCSDDLGRNLHISVHSIFLCLLVFIFFQ